jgi:hypothetical protein
MRTWPQRGFCAPTDAFAAALDRDGFCVGGCTLQTRSAQRLAEAELQHASLTERDAASQIDIYHWSGSVYTTVLTGKSAAATVLQIRISG